MIAAGVEVRKGIEYKGARGYRKTGDATVLCVDKKSQVQGLNRTQPILPLAPGVSARQSHDYERQWGHVFVHGLEWDKQSDLGSCYCRHQHQELLRFSERDRSESAGGFEVHLVMGDAQSR